MVKTKKKNLGRGAFQGESHSEGGGDSAGSITTLGGKSVRRGFQGATPSKQA